LFAHGIELVLALATLGGLVYALLALWGARAFVHALKSAGLNAEAIADVTILKPVKGIDARMYAGFCSHCRQKYSARYEILFGVTSLDDPAVAEVERLRAEFPEVDIRLVECPERLGSSGKVSNLAQMLRVAKYEHVVINDSDIEVSPRYLANVMRGFQDPKVGLVTAPYIGAAGAGATVWARFEALGISTDFMAGVLTARGLEGGMRYGLGSTLATTKAAIAKIGGLEALADCLADDYELGHRISRAGFGVELCGEVVKTTVPAYAFKGFWDHQVRWARTVRDARRWGNLGLGVTYSLPWAAATMIASGFALWSFTLLSLVLLARVTVALTVGVGVLRDGQVLRDLWLLPLRDCFALLIWMWSFAGDTVVWRGEAFRLKDGRIARV
jgi:ceramide glucosyltransferase